MGTQNVTVNINIAANANAQQIVNGINTGLRNLRSNLAALPTSAHASTRSMHSLTAGVVALSLAFAGFQGFKRFISEGLTFNKTIESTTLGIAALITAQAKLHDAQTGELLVGTKALAAAQEIAADQMVKLRIAGLQTTATTQELAFAMQQATGIGLRWGLEMDQIRILSIQMAQAAGALNVPMNQLNEEIRSLLSGNISIRNTRIASALGITNPEIRAAQKTGQLFEFVTDRLKAFTIAGAATAKTFAGVMSNVKEALQTLAGQATEPLFESMKVSGQKFIEDVFDFKNARVSDKFRGLIEVAQRTFGALGGMLGDAIAGAVTGAKELSEWFEKNQFFVNDIFQVTKMIVDQMKGLIGDVSSVLGFLIQVNAEEGGIQVGFRIVALTIALIRDGLKAVVGILGAIGGGILTMILEPIRWVMKAVAWVVEKGNPALAEQLRGQAGALDAFLRESARGVRGIFNEFAEGDSETQRLLKRMDEMTVSATRATAAARGKGGPFAKLTTNRTGTEADPDGKGGKNDPKQLAAAQTLAIKAELAEQLKDLKIALDNQRLSYRQYYEAVGNAQQDAIDKQIAAQLRLLQVTTDKGEREQIRAQIEKLEAEWLQVIEDAAEARRKAELDLAKDVQTAQITLLKDEGKFSAARAVEMEKQFRLLVAKLLAEGDVAGVEIVTRLFNIDNARARMDELTRASKVVTDTLATRLEEINVQSEAHAITEREAREAIVEAYTRARAELEQMLPAMIEAANITKDPEQLQAVENLRIKIGEMGITIRQTADEWHQLKEGARDVATSGLADFIDQSIEGAKSLGDIFRDVARDIVASLRRIAAQMLSNLIIQRAMSLFQAGGGGGAAGSAIQRVGGSVGSALLAAGGGMVYGPGTSTSDSIPAWLSSGEFVMNARAVQQLGPELLGELNALGSAPGIRGRLRARGYADGGMVTTSASQESPNAHLTVGLEAGLIAKELRTKVGSDALISVLATNRKALRAILGHG